MPFVCGRYGLEFISSIPRSSSADSNAVGIHPSPFGGSALFLRSERARYADKHALAIVVVVANKMITVARHMLKTGTPYMSRNEAMYRRKLARLKKRRQLRQQQQQDA